MQITAAMVKELRERTGAGMMECKKALAACDGDMDLAVASMRKAGTAKADKRAARVAVEGVIRIRAASDAREAAMVEVNCETDFVAKGDDFAAFAQALAETAARHRPADVEALMALPWSSEDGVSLEEQRLRMVAKLGENVQVRRFDLMQAQDGRVGIYLHGSRIGVLVELAGGDEALAKDVAMHVAASRPLCVDEHQVPAEVLTNERAIFAAQAQASGKPAAIIDKMVQGRLKKYLGEVTLVGQPFVKDPEQTVGALLAASGAKVLRFVRFEVGEGIEKKSGNFADEVMAQVKGG
ncbi:MAG: elongation factor Ts [Gammaproteobacteria bacterium]|nr:elongation factor Ts [Gammaproteobacteria bacterium]